MRKAQRFRFWAIPTIFLTVGTALATGIPGAPLLSGDMGADGEMVQAHSSLKCWQEGRLILDENGWGIPTANLPGQVIKLQSLSKQKNTIYLFDMNRSTCVLRIE